MESLILTAVEIGFMHLVVLMKLIHEANRKKVEYIKEGKGFGWKCYLRDFGLRWVLVYLSACIAMFFLPAIKEMLIEKGISKDPETLGFLSIAIASYFGYDLVRMADNRFKKGK